MLTQLQKELKETGLKEVCSKYSIAAKPHPKFPNLYQFKYDQIESPVRERVVQESRGIILDSANDWAIVAWPFNRFFNAGESHAATIDWSTARVTEKLDGSLMILYHYADSWHVATSGTPDAGGQVGNWGFTFAELFWANSFWASWINALDTNCTYIFELTSPYNRVVVAYPDTSVTLIGVRNNLTGQEYNPSSIGVYFPKVVRSFALTSLKEIEATFPTLEPTSQEGYVVVDGNFNRVKVKSPAYVALHHLRDQTSGKSLLDIARNNEGGEFLTYFPEYQKDYDIWKNKLHALYSTMNEFWSKNKDIPIQKDFALSIKDCPCNAALFMLRAGKVESFESYVKDMPIDRLMDVLKKVTC